MRIKKGLAAAVLCAAPVAAFADLEICNDTETRKTVAVGYKSGAEWASEGWWNLKPGQCATPVSGDLTHRYYYLLAKANGWTFADGNIVFCTTPRAFTIVGDADCAERGYDTGRFRQIDTGKTAKTFRVALSDHITRDKEAPASQPASAMPARGTYGEPYSNMATFQGCDFRDSPGFCSFYADGTRLIAYDDGRSNREALARLNKMLPGAPISVSGDLVAIHDVTAELVLYEADGRMPNDNDRMLDRLQGYWYAVSDPADQFNILGSERIGYRDGSYSGTETLAVQNRCDRFEGEGPYLYARDHETGDSFCYQIFHVDSLNLHLMYLPRGNILEYRRLD